MGYLGTQPQEFPLTYKKLYVNTALFNGATNTFTLYEDAGFTTAASSVGTAENLEVMLGGPQQEPQTDYTISGNQITFVSDAANPSNGTTCWIVQQAQVQSLVEPADGSIGTAKIVDSAVTEAKIADSSVTGNKLGQGRVDGSAVYDTKSTATGEIGEFLEWYDTITTFQTSSGVINIVNAAIPAGVWDVRFHLTYNGPAGDYGGMGLSTTTTSYSRGAVGVGYNYYNIGSTGAASGATPTIRLNLTTTTNYYGVTSATGVLSDAIVYGRISATRVA